MWRGVSSWCSWRSRAYLCLSGVWTNRPWVLQRTKLLKKHCCSSTGIFWNKSAQLICKFSSLNISWKRHSSAAETEHPLSFRHFRPKPERERGERHSLRQVLSAATLLPRGSWALASPPGWLTSSLVAWTLAAGDPWSLSLCSFEGTGLLLTAEVQLLVVPCASFGGGAPQHEQLCSSSVSLSSVCPAVLPGYCCTNKPKFHLKNCSYIHSTSKAKVLTREASKLLIHYHLTDLAREPQRRSKPLCV